MGREGRVAVLTGLAYVLLWAGALAYAGHATHQTRGVGWAATAATFIAWVLLAAEMIGRGVAAGHWPLTNRYEFSLCFVWAIVSVYLSLELHWKERRAGAFVLLMALLVATYAVIQPAAQRAPGPLLPVLRSAWLQAHVATAMLGYGAFGVAAGLGAMRLVGGASGETEWLPAARDIDRVREGVVGVGFVWLSLAILTGAIWAQRAWGQYWGWDPKENWALVTWLWYLAVLHLRPLRAWRGRRLAILVIVGFGLVLFTFIGVPWLVRTVRLESLHGD